MSEVMQSSTRPWLGKLVIVAYVGIIGSVVSYFVAMGLWLAGLI
ncbi:MAG: hypothetical protein QF503_01150 [Rhodospirillales bacterium]|jgi:hypothetical protein|nr:hypothetical protein [Rhodospirillales bacterium]